MDKLLKEYTNKALDNLHINSLIFEYLHDNLRVEVDTDLDLHPVSNYGHECESCTVNVRLFLRNPETQEWEFINCQN